VYRGWIDGVLAEHRHRRCLIANPTTLISKRYAEISKGHAEIRLSGAAATRPFARLTTFQYAAERGPGSKTIMHARETRQIAKALRRYWHAPVLKQECGEQVTPVFVVTVHLLSFVRTHGPVRSDSRYCQITCTGLYPWAERRLIRRHGGVDFGATEITATGWTAPLPPSMCLYESQNRASDKIWNRFGKAP
jgi:hypothetical protein